MSTHYFFTAASLPLLQKGAEPPFDKETFVEVCRMELREKDFNILRQVSLNPDDIDQVSGFLDSWCRWETSLRNELVEFRAKALGLAADQKRETSGEYWHHNLVKQIAQSDSPLESEIMIDQARWAFLDENETGHFFDLQKLIIYGLKLLLLERENLFQEELGFEKYKSVYGRIMEDMKQDHRE